VTTGHDDLTVGQRRGTLQLVAGEQDRDPGGSRVPDEAVEDVASGSVEAGVGFVEQPEPGVPHEQGGQRGPAPLAGRQAGDGEVAEPAVDAGPGEGGLDVGGAAHGSGPEADVLGDGQVVVEAGGVAEEGDLAAHRLSVAAQVDPEHGGLAPDDRHQASDGTQQGGLAGAVGPAQEHDLAGFGVEVDAGEGRETAQQADRGAEADDGVHGDRGKRYRRPSRTSKTARVVGAVGRVLIVTGVLVLLFAAYQLWGTNLREASAQRDLKRDLAPVLEAAGSGPSTTTPPAPVPGDAVALLRIPKIGLEKAVVEGTRVPDLKRGPGHYAGTPLPGEPGNAAIAGHRTTYGAPFWSLDELEPGDDILVTTRQGEFRYRVDGSQVIRPSQNEVLRNEEGNHLTLTTCNPRFSARQRLVVKATLVGDPGTPTPRAGTAPADPSDPFSGDGSAKAVTLWGLLVAAVAGLVWFLARRYHRLLYVPGAAVVGLALFGFFERLSSILPPGV
jgi:sortase A